jgi:hypothetical protein
MDRSMRVPSPSGAWTGDAPRLIKQTGSYRPMARQTERESTDDEAKAPPRRSNGLFSDLRWFILRRPAISTLIEFGSPEERVNYSARIMQRIGIDVDRYAILNIHRIGIEAPVRYVFEELLRWDGDSTCWPNHVATVDRVDDRLEHIRIFPFGWRRYPPGFRNSFFGLRFIPLFNLNAVRFQHLPGPADIDNARFLLYECDGGYPIGIFAMYVRSSIARAEESEPTQMFMVVGFNFYGKRDWSRGFRIMRLWEVVHNRVTANVLNRFKQLCEWRFARVQAGESGMRGEDQGSGIRDEG